MAELKSLPAGPKPNEDLVELLEATLEKAKSGELQAGFFAGVLLDGCYSGFSPNDRLFELIGSVTAAQYRLMALNVHICGVDS